MTRYRRDDPNKTCLHCKRSLPRTEEFFYRKSPIRWRTACRDCAPAIRRQEGKKIRDGRSPFERKAQLLLKGARVRAKDKGLPLEITIAWIRIRLEKGICEATGIKFGSGAFTASLDRRDNSKGYTEANVQMVVWIHNAARNNWGDRALHVYMKAYIKNKSPNSYRQPTHDPL